MALQTNAVKHLQISAFMELVYKYSVLILVQEIGLSQSLYLHKTTQRKNTNMDLHSCPE
jgi:hypothetical protein